MHEIDINFSTIKYHQVAFKDKGIAINEEEYLGQRVRKYTQTNIQIREMMLFLKLHTQKLLDVVIVGVINTNPIFLAIFCE